MAGEAGLAIPGHGGGAWRADAGSAVPPGSMVIRRHAFPRDGAGYPHVDCTAARSRCSQVADTATLATMPASGLATACGSATAFEAAGRLDTEVLALPGGVTWVQALAALLPCGVTTYSRLPAKRFRWPQTPPAGEALLLAHPQGPETAATTT